LTRRPEGEGDDDTELLPPGSAPGEMQQGPPEPPVVARLVVEIRSDGSRTIARGAMEDVASGQSVAIEAKGTTPIALALELAKSMFKGRSLAAAMARRLLPGRGRK
jgi:hypothetical protein